MNHIFSMKCKCLMEYLNWAAGGDTRLYFDGVISK